MKDEFLSISRTLRAPIIRYIKPKANYCLLKPEERKNFRPISRKYGYDRGKSIARVYIENFLEKNQKDIKGVCLEVEKNIYTRRFGKNKVIRSEVVDNEPGNRMATINADLKDLSQVKDNTFDCAIVTQVFCMIDDYDKAIAEIYRVLKPGGVLLASVPFITPLWLGERFYWSFTLPGTRLAFGKYFRENKLDIKSWGNVLAGQAYLVGLASEELEDKVFEYNDPHFPVIITVRATK